MEPTLRLVQPQLVLDGTALVLLAACAFVIGVRCRVVHLHVAGAALLLAAVPWLVVGGIDLLVWYRVLDHDAHAPEIIFRLRGLRGVLMMLAACSACVATYRLLRRPA